MGLPLEKYWVNEFHARLSKPSLHCVFVHPRTRPTTIVGTMFFERVDATNMFFFSGNVIPEFQNRGLLRRMACKVVEKFPECTMTWYVRPDNKEVLKKALQFGAQFAPPAAINIGNRKLKNRYVYYQYCPRL